MKVTPALLKKYNAGIATDTEQKAVEQWLDEMEPVTGRWPAGSDTAAIQREMWDGINAGIAHKRKQGRIRQYVCPDQK